MERIYNYIQQKNARLCIMYGLAFFLLIAASGCADRPQTAKADLVWVHGKAIAIAIPNRLIKDASLLNVKQSVHVVLEGRDRRLGILGDYEIKTDTVVFKPVIPLSPGLSYDIWQNNWLIGNVSVPIAKGAAPAIKAIYPEADTVPENLLKIYICFSHPMQSGNALNHIYLLDKKRDTMQRVFLNLQPELWDKTGTVLTLWLDPGRIKRDLVLNRELGNPLQNSQKYELVISGNWKDTNGLPLEKDQSKMFTVTARDGDSPDMGKWQILSPKPATKTPLKIIANENLDHYLLCESVSVLDEKGGTISGYVSVATKDKAWIFNPKSAWMAGHYRLRVAARLEDLAGNNLNRVFDMDIRKDKQQNRDYFTRVFEVK